MNNGPNGPGSAASSLPAGAFILHSSFFLLTGRQPHLFGHSQAICSFATSKDLTRPPVSNSLAVKLLTEGKRSKTWSISRGLNPGGRVCALRPADFDLADVCQLSVPLNHENKYVRQLVVPRMLRTNSYSCVKSGGRRARRRPPGQLSRGRRARGRPPGQLPARLDHIFVSAPVMRRTRCGMMALRSCERSRRP